MFKITWFNHPTDDARQNLVRLCETAPDDEVLAVPPRPVFFEELDLLGLPAHGWQYPRTNPDGSPLTAPLLWACERRYFYHGKLVLEARGGNLLDPPSLIFPATAPTTATAPSPTAPSRAATPAAPTAASSPALAVHGEPSATTPTLRLTPVNLDALRTLNAELMFYLEYEAMEFIHNTYRDYSGLSKTRSAASANSSLDFDQLRAQQEKQTKRPHAIVKEDCDSFDIMPADAAESLGKKIIHSTKTEIFIASFSGGKDSQVVLDLVSRAVPPDAFRVLYSDTGYEIPPSLEIWETTKKLYNLRHPSLQFHLSKNHQNVLYYWDKMGSPSRMQRWCCGVMKTAPLYRELKEITGSTRQPHVLTFEGSRAEESTRRSFYGRIGKGVKHNNVINARPILNWNSTEIYLYLFAHNLPINSGYKNGLSRVGCSICPYSNAWSEQIVHKIYPESIKKFVSKLETSLSDIPDKDVYIKEGSWKLRAGGKNILDDGAWLEFIETSPDFVAKLNSPRENLLEWLKTLGKYHILQSTSKNETKGELNYLKKIYSFSILQKKNSTLFRVKNVATDIPLQRHLKRVLYKTTFCVHCEVCEVECPTGALSVVPNVSINSSRCIHCHKCLDFRDKGCVSASSQNTPERTKIMNDQQTSIDRYAGFGLRSSWLSKFCANPHKFFESDDHGLNPKKQIPPLVCWLREAELLNLENKLPSPLAELLAPLHAANGNLLWEIIWINLSEHSKIVQWYLENINWGTRIPKAELQTRLEYNYENQYQPRTLHNALEALSNMFKESPYGSSLNIGTFQKEGSKTFISKQPCDSVSLPAIAYSLYKYAEKFQRHNLTLSELFRPETKSGIHHQFGISKTALERALRTLKEEKNHVLDADLSMGLDNIKLREDLSAFQTLKILI